MKVRKVSRDEYISTVMGLAPEELIKRFEAGMMMAAMPSFTADQAAEFMWMIADPEQRMDLALWLLEGAEAAGVIE